MRAIEESGLTFIGPCSRTVRQAGLKDEAKRTALAADVSVVPGVDDLTVRTLLAKASREGGPLAVAGGSGKVVLAPTLGRGAKGGGSCFSPAFVGAS